MSATLHGIDMSATDAIDQLLDFHRATFGNAVMLAAEDEGQEDPPAEESAGESQELEAGDNDEEEQDPEGSEALGDAGKKALDRMKAERREWRQKYREAAAQRDDALAKLNAGNTGDEPSVEQAVQAARAEVLAEAHQRIVSAEAKALAAKRFANPELALRLLDLSDVEVSESGDVDAEEISEQIDDLLSKYPYLAAQRGSDPAKFDSARGKQRQKGMVTRDQLKRMTQAEIAKAYDEGRITFSA